MKILFLSQGLPFPVYQDGLTVRVFHLLQEFSKRAKCHLIAFGDYSMTEEEICNLHGMATFDIVKYEAPVGALGVFKKALSSRRYYSKEFEDRIRESISEFQPDVVFAEQSFMAQYVELIKHLPNVMSAVDAISLAALRQAEIDKGGVNTLSWRYVAWQRLAFERKYYSKFDRVTVVGENDADFLRKELKLDVAVIPNGVDTVFFNPTLLAPERNAVFFSGNLSAPMNEEACIYLLREVYPAVHSVYPHQPLVIAGRCATEKIRAAMPSYVILKEDLPDMRDAMRDALLCVSPVAYGTGIKNNVLQAMAMGIPVVATKLIADPISICHGSSGIVAERGQSFIDAIFKALQDRESTDRIGSAGRWHIEENFSWSYVASTYFELFAEVIGQRKAAVKMDRLC
jgi:hypothetical protein